MGASARSHACKIPSILHGVGGHYFVPASCARRHRHLTHPHPIPALSRCLRA
ncbi:hypothetical protein AKJ09_08894 [Labilithrix luteola]|uniref:Uncharacterized protein n=1 Tax=Labilithrix luteola TaxID=1391654 RepID=A0A0K1Q8X8_9BACT|nr:hypothetical protein AKJ09_08894 [Labilithrix luteola]